MIGILDYGSSNISCVSAAVRRLGFQAEAGSDPDLIERASKIILPGVGAFGDAIASLHGLGLVEPLNAIIRDGDKPFLGICLGAQLIARDSGEFGEHKGLGWIDAHVQRLEPDDPDLRVPHTGWDDLVRPRDSLLFDGIAEDCLFYYTHSFAIYCDDEADVTGICDYGRPFSGAIQRDNIYATQFHPEKSQQGGLARRDRLFLSLAQGNSRPLHAALTAYNRSQAGFLGRNITACDVLVVGLFLAKCVVPAQIPPFPQRYGCRY